jgi:hypothetical protein
MGESRRVVVVVIVSALLIDKVRRKKKKRRYPSSKVILYRVTRSDVEGDLTPLTHSYTYTKTHERNGAYNVTVDG